MKVAWDVGNNQYVKQTFVEMDEGIITKQRHVVSDLT
jgi:hypothetical protein